MAYLDSLEIFSRTKPILDTNVKLIRIVKIWVKFATQLGPTIDFSIYTII